MVRITQLIFDYLCNNAEYSIPIEKCLYTLSSHLGYRSYTTEESEIRFEAILKNPAKYFIQNIEKILEWCSYTKDPVIQMYKTLQQLVDIFGNSKSISKMEHVFT